MPAPRGPTRAWRHAGLMLALATGACAAPPHPSSDAVNTGRIDVRLARLYLDGTEVPRDETKAAYLLSNASAVGDIDAKEMLGRLYADGRGVRSDDEMATSLFRSAVDGGNVVALTDLGRMLETGRGTKADPAAALDYYERGMDAGDPIARENYQRLKKSLDSPPPKAVPPPPGRQITSEELKPPG